MSFSRDVRTMVLYILRERVYKNLRRRGPSMPLHLHSYTHMGMANGASMQRVTVLLHHSYGAGLHSLCWSMTDDFMLIWVVGGSHRAHLLQSMLGEDGLQPSLYVCHVLCQLLYSISVINLLQQVCHLHNVTAETLNPYKGSVIFNVMLL